MKNTAYKVLCRTEKGLVSPTTELVSRGLEMIYPEKIKIKCTIGRMFVYSTLRAAKEHIKNCSRQNLEIWKVKISKPKKIIFAPPLWIQTDDSAYLNMDNVKTFWDVFEKHGNRDKFQPHRVTTVNNNAWTVKYLRLLSRVS